MSRTETLRLKLIKLKTRYKCVVKKNRCSRKWQHTKIFENLRQCKPRDFSRYFQTQKGSNNCEIPLHDFE
jgi:hypothetical protein